VLADLIRRYEALADKEDSEAVEAIAEKVIKAYGVPEDVEASELKDGLLRQLVRIANPKEGRLDGSSLLPEGIEAEQIRAAGFDKVWERLSPVKSCLFFGTDNIDASAIRELLGVIGDIPTLEEIEKGIVDYHGRTGIRPTFHQSEWLTELGRSTSATDKILRRHYGTTLAAVVRRLLDDDKDELLTKTRDIIREYWTRGIRLSSKHGDIPELGLTSFALDARLRTHCRTTLPAEVEKLLGPHAKPLTLVKVKQVIQAYKRRGIRLHRKFGKIPELDMSSHNLADRLKRNFKVTLAELTAEKR
jgi:hypothetical protein